jgi:3-(3-hydroxy-phenyl)propionate hydroxylase
VCNGAELAPLDGVRSIDLAAIAGSEVVAERLALDTGAAMLIRPDHYVAARWKRPDAEHVRAALLKAQGR